MKGTTGSNIEGIPEIASVRPPILEKAFASRAARFRSLAPGNVLSDYLGAMALLADAQHAALTDVALAPDREPLPGEFPAHAGKWPRDGAWRSALTMILSKMESAPLPLQAQAAIARLSSISTGELEISADALLAGNYSQLELPAVTFLGSALQVYWTALADSIQIPIEAPFRHECPVCASPPVAGVVLGDSKLRYLACGLCATQWRLPRLICSNCGGAEGLFYLGLDGGDGGVKAECCPHCHSYLKLFYMESAPGADPFADDVATLALDILVSEEGFSRIGSNYYLVSRNDTAED